MKTAVDAAGWLAKIVIESSVVTLTSSAIKQRKLDDPSMNGALSDVNASLSKVETHLNCLLKQHKEAADAAGDVADGFKYEEVLKKRLKDGGGDQTDQSKKRKGVSSSVDPGTIKVREVQKRLDEIAAAIEQVVSISSSAVVAAVGEKETAEVFGGRVYQMLVRSGNGNDSIITKKELSDSLENIGIYDLESMIEKIDVDGDGRMDIDKFGELYRTAMDERVEEDLRAAFSMFDEDGDGFITVDELRSVLAASLGLKHGRTVEECRRTIRKVGDGDGDGMVNFKEFKQMMRRALLAAL